MSYTIERECWNEKTYNGYKDNPYWRVTFDNRIIGLTDGGHIWAIDNKPFVDSTIREKLKVIVSECKININIEKKINLGDLVYVIELEQPFAKTTTNINLKKVVVVLWVGKHQTRLHNGLKR
jgi:hypothetical protein